MSSNLANKKLSWREKIGFGIGPIGKNMAYGLVSGNFLQFYLMNTLGLEPGYLAVMFFCARIWDGINDLMMGTIIDNTHTKYGKFRPWIMIGAVTNALVTVMLFWKPPLEKLGLYAFVTVLYVLFDATYTMIDVGYWALIPALTLDQKERNQLSIIPRLMGAIGGFIGNYTLNIVDALGGSGANKGYLKYAMIAAAVYVVTSFICAANVKEHVSLEPQVKEPFSLKKSAKILFSNDQALATVGIMVLFNTANNLAGGAMFYYFTHILGKKGQLGNLGILTGLMQGIGMFVIAPLAKKIGTDKAYKTAYLFPCVGYAMMVIFNFAAPGNIILIFIAAAVANITYGCMNVMQSVMLANAVDYGELKNGDRNEGIIFSMLTFLSKIASGLKDLILLGSFAIVGFNANSETLALPAEATVIKLLLFAAPPLFLLGAFLIHKSKYKLFGEVIDDITKQLENKREERKTDLQ